MASEIQENKKRGKHSLPDGSVSYDGFALLFCFWRRVVPQQELESPPWR